jgi:hypothetical protein
MFLLKNSARSAGDEEKTGIAVLRTGPREIGRTKNCRRVAGRASPDGQSRGRKRVNLVGLQKSRHRA